MGQPPLPAHERSWRHPSELAAEERELLRLEEAPTSARAFAMITGTLGLLAVGALMLTVTPRRSDAPIALSATTTPLAPTIAPAPAFASTTFASTTLRPTALVSTIRLATPIGDGHKALMTVTDDQAAPGTELDVQLTSGPIVTAVIDTTTRTLAFVSITESTSGHVVATELPSPDEIVTVLGDPPVTVAFGEIASIEAEEGTPVVDSDGALIGLCTHSAESGGTTVIDVTGSGGVTTTPSTSSSAPATTQPSTTEVNVSTSVAATSVAP